MNKRHPSGIIWTLLLMVWIAPLNLLADAPPSDSVEIGGNFEQIMNDYDAYVDALARQLNRQLESRRTTERMSSQDKSVPIGEAGARLEKTLIDTEYGLHKAEYR